MGYTKLDVEDVLSKLTRPEKISLLAGSDMWHTAAVEHLNIPRVRMSDGRKSVSSAKLTNAQHNLIVAFSFEIIFSKRHSRVCRALNIIVLYYATFLGLWQIHQSRRHIDTFLRD